MSWQPYVDDSLVAAGFYDATITSHTGQIWATTPDFNVTPAEATSLLPALDGDSEAQQTLKTHGFSVAGVPYALNRLEVGDDEVRYLIARCKEYGAPPRGVIVCRTARTLIFGVHDPIYAQSISFAKCSVAMYQLADLLVGMSF